MTFASSAILSATAATEIAFMNVDETPASPGAVPPVNNKRKGKVHECTISAHQVHDTVHTMGRWFHHHRDAGSRADKARAERARVHAAVSVASVAAAVAAVASGAANPEADFDGVRLDTALVSATQLLASHCIEIAELAGADHDQVAFAVDVQSPGDLMTLTAALRGT